VISTHSTKGLSRLEEVEKDRPVSGIQDTVRLKLLCALFKIADECDIDKLRAPKPVYDILEDKMPSTSKTHWLRHGNVIKVNLSYEERKIIVHMIKGYGDEDILDSLANTLKDKRIRGILTEYDFPITDYYIQYHPKVDISED
jgi:anaerobic glycerol-3-phosphate dehydrogenase